MTGTVKSRFVVLLGLVGGLGFGSSGRVDDRLPLPSTAVLIWSRGWAWGERTRRIDRGASTWLPYVAFAVVEARLAFR